MVSKEMSITFANMSVTLCLHVVLLCHVSNVILALENLPSCAVQLNGPSTGADSSGSSTHLLILAFRSADSIPPGVLLFVPRHPDVENVLLLYVENSYLKLYQNSSGSGFSNPLGTQGVNIRQYLDFKLHVLLLTYSRNALQGRQWLHVEQISIDSVPIVGNSGVSDLAVTKFLNSDFVQGWTPPFVYSRWSACVRSWQYVDGPVVPVNSTDIELDGAGGWCCKVTDVSPPVMTTTSPSAVSTSFSNPITGHHRGCACGIRHTACSKGEDK